MVIATNSGWPPQSYLDDNNEMLGRHRRVEGNRQASGRRGQLRDADWATLTGAAAGRGVMISSRRRSVTPTKARAQVIDFVGIYYFSPYVYVLHKDSTAKSVEDLKGKIIGVETATTSEDFINRRLEIDAPRPAADRIQAGAGRVRTFPIPCCPSTICVWVTAFRLDAVIAPEQTALNAIKNGYPLRILEGEYAFREPLVVIAEKVDPDWTAKVGGIIEEMKKDGTLATLTTKWYGKGLQRQLILTGVE